MLASQARFQALVQPHLGRLLRFAGRRLRNPADAEDVVQEACTRAWVAFAGLRDDALVLPWLYRILRSSLSDHFEKQTRREQLAPTLALESAGDTVHDQGAGPLEDLIASASTERIHELLRMLPEEFALAIELHDLEGFRYVDIANADRSASRDGHEPHLSGSQAAGGAHPDEREPVGPRPVRRDIDSSAAREARMSDSVERAALGRRHEHLVTLLGAYADDELPPEAGARWTPIWPSVPSASRSFACRPR